MITEPQLMPDFREGLEQALYRRASLPAAAPARRLPRVLPRPSLAGRLALGVAVLVAAIAVLFTSLPGHKASNTALGEPLILAQPTQSVPAGISAGILAKRVLGTGAEFERAIPVTAFGGQSYLLQAPTGWCVAPGVFLGSSAGHFTVSCATTATLKQIGLAVVAAGNYLALIPPGAQPPTLQQADGTTSTLTVSKLGVVTVTGLHSGDQVIRHGVDGTTQADLLP